MFDGSKSGKTTFVAATFFYYLFNGYTETEKQETNIIPVII